jgi:RNA polymerase sigma-70 factor, ECF subfamily
MKGQRGTGHQPDEDVDGATPSLGRIGVQLLFRAHAVFVASFLRRLGTPDSEVDDLVQEVFLVAHRKGGYTPGAGQPRTWLGSIALRVASTNRRTRRRRREEPNEEALQSAPAQGDLTGALEARASLVRVQQALSTLELDHRAAFVLYEFEGESCESIARSLEVPIGTVYSRLHHARQRFVEAYAKFDDGKTGAQRRRLAGGE